MLLHVVDDLPTELRRLHIRGAVMEARPDARFDDLLERLARTARSGASHRRTGCWSRRRRCRRVPKNVCSTRRYALSSERCPDGCSGYGAVMSAVHAASGSVAGLPSLVRLVDRLPRPPEVPVVLVVPAADRRVRAAQVQLREQQRAVSDVDGRSCRLSTRSRATPFQSRPARPSLCHQSACVSARACAPCCSPRRAL